MPYSGPSDPDLPQNIQDMSENKRAAFAQAFNSTMESCEGEDCEQRAFAIATAAAQRAGTKEETVEPVKVEEAPATKSLWQRIKEYWQPPLFDAPVGFKVTGNRWIAWYTNAFEDREGEYFPTQAIESDIKSMWEDGSFPELWYWHIPGTQHGQADWSGLIGKIAVATGTFTEDATGQAFKAWYAKNPVALSHGFTFDRSAKVRGSYQNYHTFEISTLPRERAANPYTVFELRGDKMALTDQQRASLTDILGKELAEKVISSAETQTKELIAQGVGFKQEPMMEEEGGEEESLLIAALTKIMDKLTALEEAVGSVQSKVCAPDQKEEEVPVDMMPAALSDKQAKAVQGLAEDRKAALLADMQANSVKQVEQRELDPAAILMFAGRKK